MFNFAKQFLIVICTYINIENLKDMVLIEYSVEGSSRKHAEERTWVHFVDFLDECEGISCVSTSVATIIFVFFLHAEGNTGCDVKDVLVFFTGADRLPPIGFHKVPKITFLHSDINTSKFSTASTCDLQLRLPTCHGEDYEAFKEAMIMSLKDNDGFGGVQHSSIRFMMVIYTHVGV